MFQVFEAGQGFNNHSPFERFQSSTFEPFSIVLISKVHFSMEFSSSNSEFVTKTSQGAQSLVFNTKSLGK